MKRFFGLMTLLVVLFCSQQAVAQADSTASVQRLSPEQRAEKLTTTMSKQLLLSKEQVEQVRAINLKYATERQEGARKNREQMKANMEARNAEMKAVLNEAQYQKYLQMERKAVRGMMQKAKARREAAQGQQATDAPTE